MVKPYDEQIENIMQNFKWLRVAKTMKALNWKWAGAKTCPSVDEMMAHARSLLFDVCKPKITGCRSGGFYASRDNKVLRLEFCAEYMDGDE